MKKTLLIVLAILVMVTLGVAQDSSKPGPATTPNTTKYSVDTGGHVGNHGCMLCHAPHSANASISSAAVTPVGGSFPLAEFGPTYTGSTSITSITTGYSGGPVAGSIYLWGTALSAQTYTTWDGHAISKGNITAGKYSAVVHTLLCMSCHDNANSSYSMGMGYGKAPGTELGTGNTVTDAYGDHIGLSQIINPSGPAEWSNASSLTNTHPVDVAYKSGGSNWLINAVDGTFQDTTFNMDGTHTGHPAKLWVDGGDGSGGAAMVECTSCHDPHRETAFAYWNGTNYTIGGTNSTIFYLRGPYSDPAKGTNGNLNANFCRSCHYSKSQMYANNNGGAK